jgi:hypothetical protein
MTQFCGCTKIIQKSTVSFFNFLEAAQHCMKPTRAKTKVLKRRTMVTINLSHKDCQLLLNACVALCEKTAHSLALFGSSEGEVYKVAKTQHDESGAFYEKIEALLKTPPN